MSERLLLLYARAGVIERIKEMRARVANCLFGDLRRATDRLVELLNDLDEIDARLEDIEKEEG